ncbi:hypothetical protein UFOVP1604_141 [uncultured Caudovirales phage]|uniref:Uncharacterized protein n=1 Tax=uncultured Caudovirales phage TaxID=2100421 RepID=A0A6J5SU50_9CAUD|nr:hypothetical protein UFOVP1604_141 [uncultured Caudovirales phage]
MKNEEENPFKKWKRQYCEVIPVTCLFRIKLVPADVYTNKQLFDIFKKIHYQQENMADERKKEIRKKAVTVKELLKGFTPEQWAGANEAVKSLDEMADLVLELSNVPWKTELSDADALHIGKEIFAWSHLSDEANIHSVRVVFQTVAFHRQSNIDASRWKRAFDYLDSNGYVLPFEMVSVEDLLAIKNKKP